MNGDIKEPIGLNELKNEINRVISYDSFFRPDNLILNLSKGEGRTKVIKYIADTFFKYKKLDFSESIYKYVELDFNGDPSNMRDNFLDYRYVLSTFSNNYKGVIGINLSDISKYLHDKALINEFIINLKDMCRDSYVVFFTNSDVSANEEKLINMITMECFGIRRIKLKSYSMEDLVAILKEKIEELVWLENDEFLDEFLMDLLKEKGANSLKDTMKVFSEMDLKILFVLEREYGI